MKNTIRNHIKCNLFKGIFEMRNVESGFFMKCLGIGILIFLAGIGIHFAIPAIAPHGFIP